MYLTSRFLSRSQHSVFDYLYAEEAVCMTRVYDDIFLYCDVW